MKQMKPLVKFLLLVVTIQLTSCGFFGTSSDSMFDLIPVKIGNDDSKISIMDKDGVVVLEDEFPAGSKIYINNGIIRETTSDYAVKYWKIKDKKIEQVGEEKYDSGTPFFENYAVVRSEEGMLSLIDKEGKEAIANLSKIDNITIVRVGIVSDGLIRFKNDEGLWGYLDTEGQIKIKPSYKTCENFVKGVARVVNTDGTFSIIKKDGTNVFSGKDGQSYYPIFDDKIPYKEDKGDYWGVMNFKGDKLIKDTKYTEVIPLSTENIIVAISRKEWGVINTTGEYVGDLRVKFETMPIISNSGEIVINEEKKVKIYDAAGKLLKEIDDYKKILPIGSNRFLAQQSNKKYIIIDNEGKELSKDAFILLDENNFQLGTTNEAVAIVKNNISIESKYFEFEALYTKIFNDISQNGVLGITAQTNIDGILKVFPYNTGGQGNVTLRSDKSDDYRIIMSHKKNDIQPSTSTINDTAPAVVDTAPVAVDSYGSSPSSTSTVKDDYPFLSTYDLNYTPQERYASGVGYRITFGFDQPLKQEIQGTDPIFKDVITTIGYSLNTTAHLVNISVSLSFGDIDSKVFWKEFEKKAIAAGFASTVDGQMQHKNIPTRKIYFGASNFSFFF
jgi:hypothetical protein